MSRFTASLAIAMALLLPSMGAAQMTVNDAGAERVLRAEEISRQGHLIATQRFDFTAAASFLRSAAAVRGGSEATLSDLMNAGHFNVYAKRSLNAASAFKAAGELALQLGDGDTAEQAFRNAAFAADRVGDTEAALRLIARSRAVSVQTAISAATIADR